MEVPTAAKMEAEGAGLERGGCWELQSGRLPLCGLAGEVGTTGPGGRGEGWWRGPLCWVGRARGRGQGPLWTFWSFLAVTLSRGPDYEYQSAVRHRRLLLCVWSETPLHLRKCLGTPLSRIWHRNEALLASLLAGAQSWVSAFSLPTPVRLPWLS